jgi:hypothetical protein
MTKRHQRAHRRQCRDRAANRRGVQRALHEATSRDFGEAKGLGRGLDSAGNVALAGPAQQVDVRGEDPYEVLVALTPRRRFVVDLDRPVEEDRARLRQLLEDLRGIGPPRLRDRKQTTELGGRGVAITASPAGRLEGSRGQISGLVDLPCPDQGEGER